MRVAAFIFLISHAFCMNTHAGPIVKNSQLECVFALKLLSRSPHEASADQKAVHKDLAAISRIELESQRAPLLGSSEHRRLLRDISRFRKQLETRPEDLLRYEIRGEKEIEEFFSQVEESLRNLEQGQKPYGLKEMSAVGFQNLMAVVEGGVGTAVGMAGFFFNVPEAYIGFAGSAAGVLALKRARELRLREGFQFLETLQGLKDTLRSGGESVVLHSRYSPPFLFRTQVVQRTRALEPLYAKQPLSMNLILNNQESSPTLIIWIEE